MNPFAPLHRPPYSSSSLVTESPIDCPNHRLQQELHMESRVSQPRHQRRKPCKPRKVNTLLELKLTFQNKHVPISNIFINSPCVDSKLDWKKPTGEFSTLVTFDQKDSSLSREDSLFHPHAHFIPKRILHGKRQEKEKEELRWLDAQCLAFCVLRQSLFSSIIASKAAPREDSTL